MHSDEHDNDRGPTHACLPVYGYRPQTQTALDCVNAMKGREEMILRQLDHMAADPEVDQRWLAIGRTQLEQAFMAINRSIFKPARMVFPSERAQLNLGGMTDEQRQQFYDDH